MMFKTRMKKDLSGYLASMMRPVKHTIGIASLVKVIGKFPTRRWYKLACWVKWMKDLYRFSLPTVIHTWVGTMWIKY